MGSGAEIFNAVINQGGTPAMLSNTLALRPAFGYRGRIFIATDTREIFRDTGTAWELIGSGGASVNIYNSNGTLTSVRTVTQNNNELTFIGGLVNFGSHGSNNNTRNIRVNEYASLGTITTGSYGAVGSNFYVSGAGSLRTVADSSSAIHFLNGGHVFLNAGSGSANSSISWTEAGRITSAGRLLWNTTTDAGFLADFNGTVRIVSELRLNSNCQMNTGGFIYAGDTFHTITPNIASGTYIGHLGLNGSSAGVVSFSPTKIVPDFTRSSGVFDNTATLIRPFINYSGTASGTLLGLHYNPQINSQIGVSHVAIQTEIGENNHYHTFPLSASNFSDRNVWTLHARLRQTLTPGADQAGAGYYVGGLHIREISASGNNTFGNATINAGGASSLQIDFTGAGTLTASQSGLRAFSGHQIFNTFGGTASGTITHFAGMQILGLYNRNSGSITPTITNAFGLIVNNLNDYSHTFTLTNRWGVYQTGGSDNNYFAGKLLVGTTTVTARQVHISGNVELTTTLAGTAGGSSGQHLSVWVNGNEYKIALLNP